LRALFGDAFARRFSIELWDATTVPAGETSRFTLRVTAPGALRTAFRPPVDLNAGRAFAAGLLDCDGDIESAVDELYGALARANKAALLRVALAARRLPKAPLPELREAALRGRMHSLERDRAAIGFHYDQPVAFYQTFLDKAMQYSCAYYDDGVETLDGAQSAKMDYILRKVRLREGERLLDIGCGWGGLVIRAAQSFGAQAFGVTLSRAQHDEAQRRIHAAGLQDRVRVELRDYRELPRSSFDKIVSVGMFEHVGRAQLPEYFATAHALLEPGGLFLNHGIADEGPARKGGRVSGFMERFVFPDGELVPVSDALIVAERTGFEVRDVENLREHYTRTLRAWVANIERNREAAIAASSAPSYRAWRLYMAGSAQGFRTARMGIFQSLLAKPRADGTVDLPATRRDLYR
jgi:cyclopropane-fatty-acyl-phospholipid synthase